MRYPYVAHHSSAPRRSLPLGKPIDRAYKLFDGDGLYLLVQPNGRKGWRLRYVKPDVREGLTSFGNYPVIGLADARRKHLEVKRMLADGIDPIVTKHQAKAEAVIKGRTFESVALDWHTEMSAKWAPGHSKTVMSRLKTHVLPLIGARAIVDLAPVTLCSAWKRSRSAER